MEDESKKEFTGVDFILKTNRVDEKYKTHIGFRVETDIPTPPQIGSTVNLSTLPLGKLKVIDVELIVDYDSYWYQVYFELLEVNDEQLEHLEGRFEPY